jgi:CheY-like chemotaxis protein
MAPSAMCCSGGFRPGDARGGLSRAGHAAWSPRPDTGLSGGRRRQASRCFPAGSRRVYAVNGYPRDAYVDRVAAHLRPLRASESESPARPSATPVRVVLAVRHAFMRSSLALLLRHEPDVHVCAQVGDLGAAVAQIESDRPDVLLLDQQLLEGRLGYALERLRTQLVDLPVVVLGPGDSSWSADQALGAGAAAYVVRDDASEMLGAAVRAAARGERPRARLSLIAGEES